MELKFTFSGASADRHDQHAHEGAPSGIPLPFAGASGAAPLSTSSVLEFLVSLTPTDDEIICEALSGDGVQYARAQKPLAGASLSSAVRSVLARAGAELPERLIESVTAVKLALGGRETEVLTELGLTVSPATPVLAQVDAALQARTGIAAGTPILAESAA